MILNFRVSNYKSFGNDQIFTTIPGKYRKKKSHLEVSKNYKSLKFSAVFGGNASGKSNFVDALGIFRHMVVTGEVIKTMRDYSFRLKNSDDKKSKFEMEIAFQNEIYAYGIAANIQKGLVLNEYLYKTTNRTDDLIFDIDRKNKNVKINKNRLNADNLNRLDIYIQDLKENEFLLKKISSSILDETDDLFYISKVLYDWFKSKLTIIRPNSRPINILGQFVENKIKNNKKYKVIDLIKSFDTGITDYKYEVMDIDDFLKKIKLEIQNQDSEHYNSFRDSIKNVKKNSFIDANIGDNYYRISYDNNKKAPKVELLTFEHCYRNNVSFSFNDESDGTMRLIELVNILYSSQFDEKVFVIDEIDRSLHPNLTIEFIKKFLDIVDDKPSQMIITTHETNVMDLDILRQDEIWIVERDNCGMSSLISLNKYNVRSDKVLDKDYLRGRYGGIPNIDKIFQSKGLLDE